MTDDSLSSKNRPVVLTGAQLARLVSLAREQRRTPPLELVRYLAAEEKLQRVKAEAEADLQRRRGMQ
jgi:hypothetical protein